MSFQSCGKCENGYLRREHNGLEVMVECDCLKERKRLEHGGATDSAEKTIEESGAKFGGQSYSKEHDQERLSSQLERVRSVMLDGKWRTPIEISSITGDQNMGSIAARLRDLRREIFGGYTVDIRARGDRDDGLFEYRVSPGK